jgi:hypothetical protein
VGTGFAKKDMLKQKDRGVTPSFLVVLGSDVLWRARAWQKVRSGFKPGTCACLLHQSKPALPAKLRLKQAVHRYQPAIAARGIDP